MKKILNLTKENNNYVLSYEEIRIVIMDKKIDSQELFNKIYSDLPENENEVEIIIETKLTEKEDQIIFKQIKSLFKEIDKEINSQLLSMN